MKNSARPALLKFVHLSFSTLLAAQPDVQERQPVAADSIYLQAVEILGFRPLRGSKVQSRLSSQDVMSHDAGAILTRIPAISGIRKSGAVGFDPVLRGFKYSQLGILIDGIQTTTVACPNRMDPPTSQVSVNTLRRVEVYKGPYSLRYGNHIGGVINFRTSATGTRQDKGFYSRISGGFESNGSVSRNEALAGVIGEKLDYQVAGSWHRGDDYHDGDGNRVSASFGRANLAVHAAYRPNKKQAFRLDVTRNFTRDADYAALPMDLRSDDTWLLHAGHEVNLGAGRNLRLSTSAYASLVDHLMDNYDRVMEPRMVNAETVVQTRNFGGRTELFFGGGMYRFSTGADLNYENADGYRTREFLMGPNIGNILKDNVWQNGQIMRTGIFADYSRRYGKVKYHLSARINLNTANAVDPDDSFESLYDQTRSLQVNTGITGGLEFRGEYFSYALWAARVQRSGNLSERFMNSFPVGLDPYELIGNPELKPEVNNQADLIITFEGAKETRIELNLFYSFLQQFISSTIRPDLSPKMPSAPGVRQYNNIERASISGFEMSLQQAMPLQLVTRVDAAGQVGKDLVKGEPLPEIPPVDLRATLWGRYFKDKMRPSVQIRYVLKQSRISPEFGESATPSFWLMDLDVTYAAFRWLTISGGVRNLFDIPYYEHLNRSVSVSGQPIYNPGRNLYLGLTARF
jgi:iron complex outermembrane receptor protein